MEDAFMECRNLAVIAKDKPNLSNVSSLSNMFTGCASLQGSSSFSNWDVSNVTNISYMFIDTSVYSFESIVNYNVSNVEDTSWMFAMANFKLAIPRKSFNTMSYSLILLVFRDCLK